MLPPDNAFAPLPEQEPKQKLWRVGTLAYTSAGLVVLFSWLLWGDFAWSVKERSVSKVLQLILKQLHTSDTLAGILTSSLPAAIAIFLAPIISFRSDRHRGRWGRRIPYLLLTTPMVCFTMFGMAFCSQLGGLLHNLLGGTSPGLNACTLIVLGTNWTLFEFATIAGNVLFAALANDVVPQQVIGRFFGMFRALSLLVGISFNYFLFGKASEYYTAIFVGMGLLYGLGFTTMCLKVKEGDYPPPPPIEEVRGKKRGFLAAAKTYLHECFGHRYYLWYFAGVALATISVAPVGAYDVRYYQSLGMKGDAYGICVAITYCISLLLSYPLGALADRIHPLRVTIISMVLYTLTGLWGGFYADNPTTFSIALVLHGIIAGVYLTAVASLPQKLLARSRFAELHSANSIINSMFSIALPFGLGSLLDHTGHVYRYTFLVGSGLSFLSLIALFVLHGKFMARGGPKNYVAPEDEPLEPGGVTAR